MKVIISGGLGSLGTQIIERYHKKWQIGVIDNDECRQFDRRREYPDVEFFLGDIRDRDSLNPIKDYDFVIHAAALKHIEVCERNKWEAVKTNINGTRNVLDACKDYNVPMVYISTDKAVEPINFYGMTKAIAERMTISEGFNCVRYGNVFGSRGSIIPLFSQLRKEGKRIPLTHKDMTRFILSLDDALGLIEESMKAKPDGRIFIKKCKACSIIDIAKEFGEYEIVGAKIGEKLHETLVTADEMRRAVIGADYFILLNENYSNTWDMSNTIRDYGEDFTSKTAERLTQAELRRMIKPWLK
jgi:FlaA1/EpsC-like NDP-sugar epimerase